MSVAQEDAQLIHHPRDRPLGIAVDAIERRARVGIEQSQAERRRHYGHCVRAKGRDE
jgi:hypothetical protein